jgi:hypothetical protein
MLGGVLRPPVAPPPTPGNPTPAGQPTPAHPTPGGPPTPRAPTPSPTPRAPTPSTAQYDCAFPAFTCNAAKDKGTYTSLTACEKVCVKPTPAPTPPPAITGITWSISWGTAGSHNGVLHSALAAGKSQQVWAGRGSGYSATLVCSRTAKGELGAHYSDTNKVKHNTSPVASGCSKFAEPGHTIQCCFP